MTPYPSSVLVTRVARSHAAPGATVRAAGIVCCVIDHSPFEVAGPIVHLIGPVPTPRTEGSGLDTSAKVFLATSGAGDRALAGGRCAGSAAGGQLPSGDSPDLGDGPSRNISASATVSSTVASGATKATSVAAA